MSGLGAEARFALEAIAGEFSADWQEGGGAPDAYVTIRGRKIAVEIGLLAPRSAGRGGIVKPRLRYDRVAIRFVRDLRGSLRPYLAGCESALFSIRAPILQAGKTVAVLEEKLRSLRERRVEKTEFQTRFSGNQIRVRVGRSASGRESEVLGFVHSAGSNPAIILNAAQSLLDCLRSKAGAAAVAQGHDRWLVLVGAPALGETYRDACSQLSSPTGFAKILLVSGDSRIETLAG